MTIINVFEAKTRLSALLELVEKGEEIVIGRYGEPIAILIPYKKQRKKRRLGVLSKKKFFMSDDFNDPLPESYFISESKQKR